MSVIIAIILFVISIKVLVVVLKFIWAAIEALFEALFSLLGALIKFIFKLWPLWVAIFIIPGPVDEGVLILVFLIVLIIKAARSGGSSFSGSSYGDYVLNRRTGVIRNRWDPSVDDVSEKNRRYISSSKAHELVSRGGKYKFKSDN